MTDRFKVVFIGDATVGKTSISQRLTRNIFIQATSTIGSSFSTLQHENIKFDIWDTAGQERFCSLVPCYYRDANIIILVFDLTNLDTIARVHKYMDEISSMNKCDHRFIIVGNKSDLLNDDQINKIISTVKNEFKYFESLETNYIMTSAKNGFNIQELLLLMVEQTKKIEKTKDNIGFKLEDVDLKRTSLNNYEINCCW